VLFFTLRRTLEKKYPFSRLCKQSKYLFCLLRQRGGTKMKRKAGASDPRVMTLGSIEEFLDHLDQQGRPVDSLDTYRRKLIALYNFLGKSKRLGKDTLAQWRDDLLTQGYANSTVNTFIYVANSYLSHVGLREYQLVRLPHSEPRPVEDLTRAEYLRLHPRTPYIN